MKQSLFSLDGDIILYEGLSNPAENWNGWAIPYFTKEVAIRILQNGREWFTYSENDEIITIHDNPELSEGSPIVCPPVIIEGKTYYSIGGRSWCWIDENPNQ